MNRAVEALRAGRLDEAERLLRKAVRAAPEDAEALHLLGIVLLQAGQAAKAVGFFDRALRGGAPVSQLYNNHATALNALARPGEALNSLERALGLAPDDAELHYNLGNTLMTLRRDEAALAAFARACGLAPGFAAAWQNRAIVQTRLGLHPAALESCDRVLALTPEAADAREARGEALLALARPGEAVAEFEAASRAAPGLAIAHLNRAHALNVTGRTENAMVAIDAAIAAEPELALAHFNAGCMSLANGDFARGWAEYEWRWRKDDFAAYRRGFSQNLWMGEEAIEGRTILLHEEQGFGDTIQFCRYAPMVAALGARVVLEVPAALVEVMRGLAGVERVVVRGEALPHFDVHCPLMSLPLAFGTDLESIPWRGAYLSADAARVAMWRERLGSGEGRLVGLAWSGARGFAADATRSAPVEDWRPLIRPDVRYVCLQKDVRAAGRAAALRLGIRLIDDLIEDFADVAALVALTDACISVDSAPAHLAGAMGRQVVILLPEQADWRWLRGRGDTPWYPSARLMRMGVGQGWAEFAGNIVGVLGF